MPVPALLAPTLPHLGLVPGISNEQYHAGPGLSHSGLVAFARSPSHYYATRRDPNRPPEGDKAGQLEGTLAHCMLFEPEQFAYRFVVGPDVNRNTKEWRAFVEAHPQRVAIKPDQYETARMQAASVRSHFDLARLIGIGKPEISAYWRDEASGVICKCRPDWVHPVGDRGVILLDAKTYADASPEVFARQVARKRYHWQAAWYTDGYSIAAGVPVVGFVFIAIESAWPYACSGCMLDEDSLDVARREYAPLVEQYAICDRENHWPAYPGLNPIKLPRWYGRGSDE